MVLGESNENSIIVEQGLAEGDEIYISVPEESEKWKIEGLELVSEIKSRKAKEALKMQEMKQMPPDTTRFKPGGKPGEFPKQGKRQRPR